MKGLWVWQTPTVSATTVLDGAERSNDWRLTLTYVRRLLRDDLPCEVERVLGADVILLRLRYDSHLEEGRHNETTFTNLPSLRPLISQDGACIQLTDHLSPRPRRRWSPEPPLGSRTSPVAPGPRGCRSWMWNVSRPSQEYLQLWFHGRYHALLSGPDRSSPGKWHSIRTVDWLCNRTGNYPEEQ